MQHPFQRNPSLMWSSTAVARMCIVLAHRSLSPHITVHHHLWQLLHASRSWQLHGHVVARDGCRTRDCVRCHRCPTRLWAEDCATNGACSDQACSSVKRIPQVLQRSRCSTETDGGGEADEGGDYELGWECIFTDQVASSDIPDSCLQRKTLCKLHVYYCKFRDPPTVFYTKEFLCKLFENTCLLLPEKTVSWCVPGHVRPVAHEAVPTWVSLCKISKDAPM